MVANYQSNALFPLGWHSQRDTHFPSRITGAEFVIPWALIISIFSFHIWEKCPGFKPNIVSMNKFQWININGSVIDEAQGIANKAYISDEDITLVLAKKFISRYVSPCFPRSRSLHHHHAP